MSWGRTDVLAIVAAALLVLVVWALAFASTADAGLSKREFRERSWAHLRDYQEARRDRCRPVRWHGFRTPRGQIAPGQRWYNLYRLRTRKWRAIRQTSKCLPTDNIGIIRWVWPDAIENDALNVAYCESAQVTGWARAHLARNPTNPRVKGAFQIDELWERFYPGYVWSNPWHNAELALWIYRNHGGFRHWHCQPHNNPFGPEPF